MIRKFLFAFFIFLAGNLSFCQAGSYDIYVDSGYKDGDSNGTTGKPFSKISDGIEAALENSANSQKIFIRKGTYNEKLTLKESLALFGEDQSKTIIADPIKMEDKSNIHNLTISGGSSGITIEGEAEVSVENCKINDSRSIGINALPGKGSISISGSIISKSHGKGLYIQEGRTISLSGNSIYLNAEEGIDLRSNISGKIASNEVSENGEGGIELIIGSSTLEISGNTVRKNKASGISVQFYKENSKKGKIDILNNIIENNGKYGLDCNLPSGGAPTASYWSDSINFEKNTLNGNRIKPINDFCHIIDAVEEEEVFKKNAITEKLKTVSEMGNETAQRESREQAAYIEEIEKEERLWKKMEEASLKHERIQSEINASLEKLKSRNFLKNFFIGIDFQTAKEIRGDVKQNELLIIELERIINLTKKEETKNVVFEVLEKIKNKNLETMEILEKNENRFSLFGWLFKYFYP